MSYIAVTRTLLDIHLQQFIICYHLLSWQLQNGQSQCSTVSVVSVVWSAQEGSFKAFRATQSCQCFSVPVPVLPCGKGDVLAVGVCQFAGFHSHLAQHCWIVCKVFKAPLKNVSMTWHLTVLNVGVPRRLQSSLWYTFDSGEGKANFPVFTGK